MLRFLTGMLLAVAATSAMLQGDEASQRATLCECNIGKPCTCTDCDCGDHCTCGKMCPGKVQHCTHCK